MSSNERRVKQQSSELDTLKVGACLLACHAYLGLCCLPSLSMRLLHRSVYALACMAAL